MPEWMWRKPKPGDTLVYSPPKKSHDFDRWSSDSILTRGKKYTVKEVVEGRGKVCVTLEEVPQSGPFNMVLFDFFNVPEPE